ncbi:hypothetical protein QBC39DRAFT_311950 [Podospora conica]|nr:hypothetical protein QBC39DRAFT_311950 [Schizothecium conicum]
MKNDHYLNLCLEQAAHSPLFYRHGSIVVKGGKVIGQGFNDHRPGYDGGALKTGQLPTAPFPFPMDNRTRKPTPPGFTPFERVGGGGGHHANVCLSMHSEMMAIHSALASSSTLAASTASHIKPCFKLSGRHAKPGRLLRTGGSSGGAIKSYVESVCLEAMGSGVQRDTGAPQDQEWRFEAGASGRDDASEQQDQSQSESESEQSYKTNKQGGVEGKTPDTGPETTSGDGRRKQTKSSKDILAPPQNHILLPKGRAMHTSRKLAERMEHPKLVGADVYVARLANSNTKIPPKQFCASLKEPPASTAVLPTGSLHDELICKVAAAVPILVARGEEDAQVVRSAVDSRPCYRCVCYMHGVGVKRVFWTNGEGEWEGAKVRDLVDMLEGGGDGSSGEGSRVAGLGVFVTKHEVLMLRRLLGT